MFNFVSISNYIKLPGTSPKVSGVFHNLLTYIISMGHLSTLGNDVTAKGY